MRASADSIHQDDGGLQVREPDATTAEGRSELHPDPQRRLLRQGPDSKRLRIGQTKCNAQGFVAFNLPTVAFTLSIDPFVIW